MLYILRSNNNHRASKSGILQNVSGNDGIQQQALPSKSPSLNMTLDERGALTLLSKIKGRGCAVNSSMVQREIGYNQPLFFYSIYYFILNEN